MRPAVEIVDVSKNFGNVAALEQINLQVRDNEFAKVNSLNLITNSRFDYIGN